MPDCLTVLRVVILLLFCSKIRIQSALVREMEKHLVPGGQTSIISEFDNNAIKNGFAATNIRTHAEQS